MPSEVSTDSGVGVKVGVGELVAVGVGLGVRVGAGVLVWVGSKDGVFVGRAVVGRGSVAICRIAARVGAFSVERTPDPLLRTAEIDRVIRIATIRVMAMAFALVKIVLLSTYFF